MLTAFYIDYTLVSQPLSRVGKVFIWILDILLLVIGLGLTPVYFYLKKSYLSGFSDSLSISVVAISIFVTILSLAAIGYLLRRNMKRHWISVYIAIISVP